MMLALITNLAVPLALAESLAAPPSMLLSSHDVETGADGMLRLSATAPPAPAIYGTFKRFGLAISPAQPFSSPFRTIRVDYTAAVPNGSQLLIDVRASADGVRWTAWELDLPSGATATFSAPARFAQYRATLLGGRPTVGPIQLTALPEPAVFSAMEEAAPPVAATYKVHATRMGMVGGRTANGHRITKRDHFVSLPSRRSLSSNGGNEYMVRVTYNGRSSVAPVYDVGPWNINDNYWDEQRDKYADLPRGYPEDHAAYFDKYNGGRAEKGRVSFPTAIDIGDGVWWDDLGIKGDRAVVEVTFLWLGSDPLAAPPAPEAAPPAPEAAPPAPAPESAPPAPAPAPEPAPPPPAPPAAPEPPPAPAEFVVDDGAAGFAGVAEVKWYDGPKDCGSAGHALWTYTTTNPSDGENSGRWQTELPAEALYDVYVAVPACAARKANTGSARYLVQHRDGGQEVVIDQAASAGQWVHLGRFPFGAGNQGFVELNDVAGDAMHALWFDAVKWVRAE
jgi:hypothetical protein